LSNVSERIEKTFPEFIHGEHFVGRITVQKEGLAEQG